MKKIAIFLIALLLGVKVHAQVCPLPEAVDFIAKDYSVLKGCVDMKRLEELLREPYNGLVFVNPDKR